MQWFGYALLGCGGEGGAGSSGLLLTASGDDALFQMELTPACTPSHCGEAMRPAPHMAALGCEGGGPAAH